jgi:hypothetical protein
VPAPNRVPPPVDPVPDPVVPPPVVGPVPPVEAPPVPEEPPYIPPIEIIDVPVIPPIVISPIEDPPVENPPSEDPPAYESPIEELPQVDPVPPIAMPRWNPVIDIISLPFILPEGSLTEGRYVFRWGGELLTAEPWIGGTIDIDIGTMIDETQIQLFATVAGGDTPYQGVLISATNNVGGVMHFAYDSNGDVFLISDSLDAGVPEPTGAAMAALSLLIFSMRARRRD